jgi:hypothetical protein
VRVRVLAGHRVSGAPVDFGWPAGLGDGVRLWDVAGFSGVAAGLELGFAGGVFEF